MPATRRSSVVPFWNVTGTVSPTDEAELLGRVVVDQDAAVGEVGVAAVAQVEVDELLDDARLDGADARWDPPISAWVMRIGLTAATSGTPISASATPGGRPWNDSSVTR